jgi:hypothetical protein
MTDNDGSLRFAAIDNNPQLHPSKENSFPMWNRKTRYIRSERPTLVQTKSAKNRSPLLTRLLPFSDDLLSKKERNVT